MSSAANTSRAPKPNRHLIGPGGLPCTIGGGTGGSSVATGGAVGLNWYLTRNVRQSVGFERTTFDGGRTGGDRREPQNVIIMAAEDTPAKTTCPRLWTAGA